MGRILAQMGRAVLGISSAPCQSDGVKCLPRRHLCCQTNRRWIRPGACSAPQARWPRDSTGIIDSRRLQNTTRKGCGHCRPRVPLRSWCGVQAWGGSHVSGRDDARLRAGGFVPSDCSGTAARPLTVGHLGQSLDGFIATRSGDSQTVTGDDNIVHLHRMRALSDAVVVGYPHSVAADDPQLTTRLCAGTKSAARGVRSRDGG